MSEVKWLFVKPLKDENVIAEFEKNIDVSLPDDFVRVVKQFNGGRPAKNIFDTASTKECVFNSLLSFNSDDIDTIYKVNDIIAIPDFVAIANDGFGNFIGFEKNEYKVCFYNHETSNVELIADNFEELLSQLRSE
jgi:hypothetical protein